MTAVNYIIYLGITNSVEGGETKEEAGCVLAAGWGDIGGGWTPLGTVFKIPANLLPLSPHPEKYAQI